VFDLPVEPVDSQVRASVAKVKEERPRAPGVSGVASDSPEEERNKSPTPELFHSCFRASARSEAPDEMAL